MVNPVDPFGFNFTQSYTKHVRTVERIDRAHVTREELEKIRRTSTHLRRTAHARVQHACITELATLAFAPQFALIARYERANAPRRASSQAMTHVTGTGSFIRDTTLHNTVTPSHQPNTKGPEPDQGTQQLWYLYRLITSTWEQEHAYEICGTERDIRDLLWEPLHG